MPLLVLRLLSVQPKFFITLDDALSPTAFVTVTYAALGPDETRVAQWSQIAEASAFGLNWVVPLNGTLICSLAGSSSYTITLAVDGFTPLTIAFAKQCSLPLFDIGSFEHGNNVMQSNVAQPTFSAYTLTQDVHKYNFHIYLAPVQTDPLIVIQPFTLLIKSSRPDILQITPINDDGWDGFAMPDTMPFGWEVSASFNCLSLAGDVSVDATLYNFGWASNFTLNFHYRCGQSLPLPGLSINFLLHGAQMPVAVDGRAIRPWNTTYSFQPDETYDFVLFLQSNTVSDPVPFTINIISEDSSTLFLNPTSPTNGTLLQGETTVFLSEIVCQRDGHTRGLVQLVAGNYTVDPVQMLFMYDCSSPLFDIGSVAGATDIMSRGAKMPNFQSHITGDQNSIDVYISMDSGNTAESNGFHLELDSDQKVLSNPWYFDRLNGSATKDEQRSAQNPVTIYFNCLPCVTQYSSPLVVTFVWGWSNPISVSYYKDCVAAPSCNGGGDGGSGKHHGMTPAGTAALVIFFLSFGACVAGCAYNKFSLHKSGWNVVPGASSAANCFDGVSTRGRANRWTPQENDDDGLGSSANYNAGVNDSAPLSTGGGGYQSYSSNL